MRDSTPKREVMTAPKIVRELLSIKEDKIMKKKCSENNPGKI